jgi:hypothetical protein
LTTNLNPLPPRDDFNKSSDNWRYVIGVNVIPAKSKKKVTFITWKQSGYQDSPISEEQHNEWKRTNAFAEGMAVITGKVWRGEHAGEYFNCIDCDNKLAIQEFCTKDGQTIPLGKIAEKFIVEQHKDNPNKAHIYFYSKIPIVAKSSSTNTVGKDKIDNNEVPGFEIKSQSNTIVFCAPSYHQNGEQIKFIGNCTIPITLNERESEELMQHLDNIHKKYGMQYRELANRNGKSLIPMEELEKDDFVIYERQNRHEALLRRMESKIRKKYGKWTWDEIKENCYAWNHKHCKPPLDDKEFKRQWKDAKEFIVPQIEEELQQRTKQKQIGSGKLSDAVGEEEDGNDDDSKRTARAKMALELAIAHSKELFVNEFGRPFTAMKMQDGHVEVHPMDEQRFKNWISGIYYQEKDDLLNEEELKKIVRILTAKAEFDGNIPRHRLDVRVRGYNNNDDEGNNNDGVSSVGYVGSMGEITENFDAIYYDLTNKKWEAIKITPEGWDIDSQPPILFRRYGSERPQPYPDRNYPPDILDKFLDLLNLKPQHKETQKELLKPLTITNFWPNTTPKPVLILPAAQGSAKTTAFELIRDLADPNIALTSSLPKEDFNLKQLLSHNFISFFDNVSDISDSQSDIICRAVTGAGDMKRALYENDTDVIYNYRRIIGLNGITNAATRADLLDRGIIVELGEITRKQRDLLRIIWRKNLGLKPKLLAFCLDVIVDVMKERQRWKGVDEDYFGMKNLIMEKGGLPRMADWAILAEQTSAAIAKIEGKPYRAGQFLEAFDKNLEILNIEALKTSLLAEALIAFMTEMQVMKKGVDLEKYGDSNPHWEGSPTMLLSELNYFIDVTSSVQINTKSRSWPQDPTSLGKQLAGIATNLRTLGIIVASKRTNQNVLHNISKLPTPPTLPTQTEESRSDDGSKACREQCREPTQAPTPKEGQNHTQNEPSVGSVGSVRKTPDMGAQIVHEVIEKAMKDSQGNNKGYFTLEDFIYFVQMLPNERWTENEVEQTVQSLVQEGVLGEFESGRYRRRIVGAAEAEAGGENN